jgi:hypothetical protein
MSMLLHIEISVIRASTDRQQRIYYLECSISYNPRARLWHLPTINVLTDFVGKTESDMVTVPVWKWASTARQQFCVLYLVSSKGCARAFIHNQSIGHLNRENRWYRHCFAWQWASTARQHRINMASTEHQPSVKNLGYCILYDSRAVRWHLPIMNVLAAFGGKREGDMVTSPVWKWTSTVRQRFWVLHHVSSKGWATAVIHNISIGRLYRQNH